MTTLVWCVGQLSLLGRTLQTVHGLRVLMIVPRKIKKKSGEARKRSTRVSTLTATNYGSEPKRMQSAATRQRANLSVHKESDRAYVPPSTVVTTTLGELIQGVRAIPEDQQERLGFKNGGSGTKIWLAGDAGLVRKPCVAVVGARDVSSDGAARSRRLARELAKSGVVVVSGLAKGVDTAALSAAIETGGRTVAVIGTPVMRAYPAENKRLQEIIYNEHLLISQFPPDRRVFPSNFPERNKLMAAVSDATVIMEATDESGSLHQAWECVRLKRWLFIARSLVENQSLRWTKDFLNYPNTKVLANTSEILRLLSVN
jgi:DNA processing protein